MRTQFEGDLTPVKATVAAILMIPADDPIPCMKPTPTLLLLAGLMAGTISSASGPALWEKHCASCHGPDGKGATMMGRKLKIKDLTDPAHQAAFTDADAAKAIREGIKSENGKTRMKPIEGVTDDDVRVLVAHVRTLARK